MISRIQLEARVLEICDTVKSGARVEDVSVELKAVWPEPLAIARRLAGHANAARGEHILWIIGLDENSGVRPLGEIDVADWWSQVRSQFDDITPSLSNFVVPTEDGIVHALLFDTSLSPFVVKNTAYGKQGGGSVEREVPWREGTAVRSARRTDLIRLLAPLAKLPEVEVLSASASMEANPPAEKHHLNENNINAADHLIWHFHIEMYVTPVMGELAVLPLHQTQIEFSYDESAYIPIVDPEARYYAPSSTIFGRGGFQTTPDSVSVEATTSEAIVHLPGRVNFRAQFVEPLREVSPGSRIGFRFTVHPVHTERSLQLEVEMLSSAADSDGTRRWIYER